MPNVPDVCGDASQSAANCMNRCPPTCDPCQAPYSFPPCPPGGDCTCPCPCDNLGSCCYQQPPRVQPIRPVGSFMRSCAPLETDTIYRRSYYGGCCEGRVQPIKPFSSLAGSNAPMEKCTIQKLSYMPPCVAGRTAPIRPKGNSLGFQGPIYAMTSQKHDYVPKYSEKRCPIKPRDALCSSNAPMERCTINKLSYMPVDVCQFPPPKSMPQGSTSFCKPTGPMERCTVQKLSYMPVCLPGKEPMPWANKIRCVPPNYGVLCTTYNLSYLPNCGAGRTQPVRPLTSLKTLGNDAGNVSTVYKLSYMPNAANATRPPAVYPENAFCRPTGPMEKCTIQKLSYQPNCCAERTRPIRPTENGLKFDGPMYWMTTQKHDYVCKPNVKRCPLKPPTSFCRPTGPLERCTINKLSYMPVNVSSVDRSKPIMPQSGFCRAEGPVEKCTTYKLSYQPNCIQPKDPMPWKNTTAYCRPTAPIEKCTIQKLSYGPPGSFNRCGPNCKAAGASSGFPKAGIC